MSKLFSLYLITNQHSIQMKDFYPIYNLSLDDFDPAEITWFQHKLDQSWDHGFIVDISDAQELVEPTDFSSPYIRGELSMAGQMPHPESDDDTLQTAQMMGLQLDSDQEHLQELNMAADINKAEAYFRNREIY